MQETKYGTTPIEELLHEGMRLNFEIMCIFYESLLAMVHCYSIYINVYYLFQFSLFSPIWIHSLHFIVMFVDGTRSTTWK